MKHIIREVCSIYLIDVLLVFFLLLADGFLLQEELWERQRRKPLMISLLLLLSLLVSGRLGIQILKEKCAGLLRTAALAEPWQKSEPVPREQWNARHERWRRIREAEEARMASEADALREDIPTEAEVESYSLSDFAVTDIIPEAALRQLGSDVFFSAAEIDEETEARITGSSYVENGDISIGQLRYLHVLHADLCGAVHLGELICNEAVAEDMLYVFRELYEARYPIEQMRLVDDFAADDVWSATENNTSCFNYRLTTGGHRLSYHALGLAIDINPRYNPYVIYGDEGIRYCVPEEALPYADRDAAYPYKIAAGDLCCRLFQERGFRWGGDWTGHPDYMHFSKTEFAEES